MRRAAFALLLALGALTGTAQADDGAERVTRFDSDMTIQADGSLSVTETIAVHGANDTVRHGIYRFFPAVVPDTRGLGLLERVTVAAVTLDGRDTPYAIQRSASQIAVVMGDPNMVLAPGDHVFVLRYTTNGHLDLYQGVTAMRRNVTGTAWTLPIDKASATMHLPPGGTIKDARVATGRDGALAAKATAEQTDAGTFHAVTTQPLAPGDSLTVTLSYTGGTAP